LLGVTPQPEKVWPKNVFNVRIALLGINVPSISYYY
jgi:hypothetical protein